MRIEFIFIICLMLSSYLLNAQNLPSSLNSKLPKPSISNSIPTLPTKPEIPYLEELKQIHSLKRSYDSLRRELTDLKEINTDSTQRDSLFSLAKERSKALLEHESKTLESLIESEDIPGEEIKNAARNTLDRVNDSKARLEDISQVDELESLLDLNEENLKALTNEWIMPKVEQILSGVASEGLDPRQLNLPDFYGKDALGALLRNGLPSEDTFENAKGMALEKGKHITDEQIQGIGGNYAKLSHDSLGNLQTLTSDIKKKKLDLFEPNQLTSKPTWSRLGMIVWYDPLSSLQEGFYGDLGLSYRFTQQLTLVAAYTLKHLFDKDAELIRRGEGFKAALRFSKANWFFQGEAAYNYVHTEFPTGFEHLDYDGKKWSSTIGFGRSIPITKNIQSVIIGSVQPFFNSEKSLTQSRFQLKIGLELVSFKKIKKEAKELLPTDEWEEKGKNEVNYFLKDIDNL
jgi:hypothetical protein